MSKIINNFKKNPSWYSLMGFIVLAAVAFVVCTSGDLIWSAVASNAAAGEDAVVETAEFKVLRAESQGSKSATFYYFELARDDQQIPCKFDHNVSASHSGAMNEQKLLEQFEQYNAGDLVEVRYARSDARDTYYILNVVGPAEQ